MSNEAVRRHRLRMLRIVATTAFVAVVVLGPAPPATGQAIAVTVEDQARATIAVLKLRVPVKDQPESQTIFLRQAGTTATGVTLVAPTVTFTPTDVTIPPAPDRVAVIVSAGAGSELLQRVGINLTVKATSVSIPLLDAEIIRSSALLLESHDASGVVEAAWPVAAFTSTVRARSTSTRQSTVTVDIDPLTNPSAPSRSLRVDVDGRRLSSGDTVILEPQKRLVLTLGADLEAAGEYRSRIQLQTSEAAGTSLSIPVKITRTSAAPSLAFDATAPVRIVSGTDARVRLDGKETAGREVRVASFGVGAPRRTDAIGVQDDSPQKVGIELSGTDVTKGTTLAPNGRSR